MIVGPMEPWNEFDMLEDDDAPPPDDAVDLDVAPMLRVKVVGVSFHPGYPMNLHRLRDTPLTGGARREASLIREPWNRHDANAIAVLIGGDVVGHLPAQLAGRLAPRIDAGERYVVTDAVVLVNPEHDDRPGLLLDIESAS